MADQFREVTTRSWGSRIFGSFVGVLIGLLLFIAAFPLIIWNEGRSVQRIKTLGEGRAAVIDVSADAIDPSHEGALVHISGKAETGDTLSDTLFGVEVSALKLARTVEMYQWKEKSESQTSKNLGGSETTETVYTYEKVWSGSAINSSGFKKPYGHENPQMPPYESEEYTAADISVSAFGLSQPFVSQISEYQAYPVSQENLDAADPEIASTYAIANNGFFRGNPGNPQIGAVRVSYRIVEPQIVSAIGKQEGDSLQTFATTHGTINLLEPGTVASGDMFAAAESENKFITWLIRIAAFAMMWIGLSLVLGPLSVIGDVIPFIGSLIGAGTGLVALVLAAVLSAITAAIAWIAFRPVIGLTLLAIAAFFLFGGIKWLRGKAAGAAAAPGADQQQYGRPTP
jgi:hypothetical protein